MSSPSTSISLSFGMMISESTFLPQFLDAGLRDLLPLALEPERPRDHRDRQDAHALRDVGDDRGRAGARAAAHAGRDEQHVGAGDHFSDAIAIFHRRVAADLRLGARAEAARERRSQLQLRARGRTLQRLRIGIGADELHAGEPALDHVFDRVAAAAAHADDFDDGTFVLRLVDDFKHGVLLLLSNRTKRNCVAPGHSCFFVVFSARNRRAQPTRPRFPGISLRKKAVFTFFRSGQKFALNHCFILSAAPPMPATCARAASPRRNCSRPSSSSPTAVA